jgi:hypothetical protein
MSLKIITLTIPEENILDIGDFSPEENLLMLKIGSSCLLEGRKVVAGLSQKQIYQKIKDESKEEIQKLEMNIILEKELTKRMEERISKMYDSQVEQLNKKLEIALSQIEIYKEGNSASLNEELNKVNQKYDLLLQEKDRQNHLNREVFDKATMLISKNLNKSSISLGDDGEQIFENLADTFKDFENYKIENKSKQSHKGDFHLFFKDFNILVDSKNYSGSVQKKEIIKIESDLSINDNMHFAWMVSLNSNICEYNKFTIMTKWITTDVGVKCILFINNLLSNKEPRDILRQAWMICNDFHRLTKKTVKEDGELEKYREKFLLHKKLIENLQERAAEIRRGVNVLQNSVKNLDNELLEILSLVSDDIVNEKFVSNNKIKEWWDENIEYVNDESKMTSTEIWSKFKKENKEYVGENKITIELFKIAITSLVSSSNYVEKSKSIIEFNGFKWKQIEVKALENIEIENIVIEKKVKVKKVKKEKSIEFYFDEETDKKILEEYENEENDIMTISLINNIRPWEVVSLLVRYKIINSRGEARGYDKYKETEEYKSKIVNNKTHD